MNDKLLLWDIDGTLMSCYNDGTLALNETFRRRTGHDNVCGEVKVGTLMDSALVDSIMREFEIPSDEKNEIIKEFSCILKEIVTNNKTKRVLPGIKQILDSLIENDRVYMGLITSNFQVGARIKLESVGLEEYFSFGGFGDFPGEKWDAARQAVGEAERLAGKKFLPEDIFVIGDTAYDVKCANKIGARSIAVATGWMDYDSLASAGADYLFDTLEDTSKFLRIICGNEFSA